MRAGQLRRRVSVQTNTPTTSSRGEKVPSWAITSTVWARVVPMSSSDVEQSNKLTNKRQYEVTVRAGSGITTANRLLWDGKYLSVNAAIDDERRRQTLLTCTEVAE